MESRNKRQRNRLAHLERTSVDLLKALYDDMTRVKTRLRRTIKERKQLQLKVNEMSNFKEDVERTFVEQNDLLKKMKGDMTRVKTELCEECKHLRLKVNEMSHFKEDLERTSVERDDLLKKVKEMARVKTELQETSENRVDLLKKLTETEAELCEVAEERNHLRLKVDDDTAQIQVESHKVTAGCDDRPMAQRQQLAPAETSNTSLFQFLSSTIQYVQSAISLTTCRGPEVRCCMRIYCIDVNYFVHVCLYTHVYTLATLLELLFTLLLRRK